VGGSRRTGLTRRQVLGGLAGAALAPLVHAAPRTSRARPPNFVFVLSDNHRFDAMAAAGHPFVRTPAMDRLAREGLLFRNAFCTTPLCSPARASFLTGLYASRHRVKNNATHDRWDEGLVTFLELLHREAGYATAFVGKWHMPGSGLPALRGVDRFVTFTIEDGQGRYFDCPLVVDGKPAPSRRPYITEELTDRGLAFVEAHREEPFCLYLSHKAVHHPWKAAPDLDGIYADASVELPPGANRWTGFTNGEIWGGFERPIDHAIRAYMETVTSLDREIGRLLDRLDALGLAEDTVVIYASDNGFLFGEQGHVELRWPFEQVIRVPFLLRGPRVVPRPGARPAAMALNIDVAPTLLELAGVTPPESMQGSSLVPVIRDPDARGRDEWLVEGWKEFPYNAPTYRGVRTRRYLYVEYEEPFAPTLHDVVQDPEQRNDLMGAPEAERVLPDLRARLDALRGEALRAEARDDA